MKYHYRNVMSRRTLLRGAGSVAIGLPLLDEMRATSVYAADPEPPFRAFNVFFGLGVPKEIAAEGFTSDALTPLAPLADKLALLRGINLFEGDGPGNNHFDGGGACFTGVEPPTVSRAGGPSIDQVIKNEKYPQGPDTLINTLMMGTFFRRKLDADFSLTRYVHCWNDDGTPVDVPIESPDALFDRIFGEAPNPADPLDLKAKHYERSVLDSVVSQYQHYTSDAGGLRTSSRSKIEDHFEKIRELEKRLFPNGELSCDTPTNPGVMPLLNGQEVDAGGGGPDLTVNEWVPYWQAMADLYALAIQCDITRFGMALFQSGGERIRLAGDWDFNGQTITFNDAADSPDGSHEYWHSYNANNANTELRWHTHFIMTQIAYFLQRLDDPTFADENGKTILENALISISTELGDGSPHNLESVFHAVTGANDRIRTGQIYDLDASGTDLYNTILQSLGIAREMGTPSAFNGVLNQILV